MMWVGGTMLVVAWLLPLLVVIRVIPPSFWLAFVSVVLLVAGTAVGFYAVFQAYRARRE